MFESYMYIQKSKKKIYFSIFMISVCKNASHYHSVDPVRDFFCEEAKIRAKKRI